jgi:nucleotide-binding universal stress UspA family protein
LVGPKNGNPLGKALSTCTSEDEKLGACDKVFATGSENGDSDYLRRGREFFMPQIKKILFPVDFADACVGAARYVEAFAGQFEAEIMLLHAAGKGEDGAGKTQLDDFLASELKSFTTHRVYAVGDHAHDPARAIAETARSWQPDLVMMPTHGLGFFRSHLLGSVTAKTLHDLKCPIWTSVHAETAPPLEEIHCRKILCSVDLTERSQDILAWAAWLAGEYQASLGIVHATVAADALTAGWHLREEFAHYAATQAKLRLDALQRDVGTAAQAFVSPGIPKSVVATAASEFQADLLVIGRHGKTGLVEDLFPNANAILRESPCPVISI